MRNNILREDLDAVIEHLKQDDPILTHGANVRAFEAEWSAWLGVKYSVFVNSGASANLLSMAILKIRHPQGGEVIVPPLAWVSDVASVLQNGFKPVFADIDPRTLSMNPAQILARISDKTRAVFLTHAQGFDGLTDELLDELKRRGIPLIEDVCESHGATHNGSFDLSYLRCLPNMTVMAPSDENECRQMLYTATTLPGPSAVRYPRGQGPGVVPVAEMSALPVGRAELRREGRSGLALLAFGTLVEPAEKIAERLDATVVNMRFVKPLDEDLVLALASRHRAIVTLEENATAGGAGSAIGELLAAEGLLRPLLHLGIPDRFIDHGSRDDSLAAAGLDLAGLSGSIERWWALQVPERARSASGA